jgi:regulator of protease activity HflC (stomatin/prohibitin superfamily)
MTESIKKFARALALITIALWILPTTCTTTIGPDRIGVRQSNLSGVSDSDLEPGWAFAIPGVHNIITLPKRYEYLDYTADVAPGQPLQIRTKDNNIVLLDVSVPYRIRPGEAWQVVQTGNHQIDANERYRFQRLAEETTVSVLREHLAELTSSDFYSTDRRLDVSASTLEVLNEKLTELHLEASGVLIRQVQFRPEYEQQLQQIQLNEQKKLLDAAAEIVATQQQTLDNYVQGTNALASAREQKWIERRANLERAYRVGAVDVGSDTAAGGARSKLVAMTPEERTKLIAVATAALQMTPEEAAKLDDAYLIGIQNVQAETLQYDQRVRAEADGVSMRLQAEADAMLAKVRGEFDAKRNALLATAAGRAFVAWEAAAHLKFASELNFASGDGVPSVLRLREFALRFMGEREK